MLQRPKCCHGHTRGFPSPLYLAGFHASLDQPPEPPAESSQQLNQLGNTPGRAPLELEAGPSAGLAPACRRDRPKFHLVLTAGLDVNSGGCLTCLLFHCLTSTFRQRYLWIESIFFSPHTQQMRLNQYWAAWSLTLLPSDIS